MQPRLSWGCPNALQDERQASRALSPRTSICSNPKPRTFSLHAPRPPGEASFLFVTLPFGHFCPWKLHFGYSSSLFSFVSCHFGFLCFILAIWGFHFLSFWPFGPSFSFVLAFWAFISFHFGFLGLHFLSFWPFGPSFPFILAFWAFISFHFGLLGLHFLSFWPFGPSCAFILAF